MGIQLMPRKKQITNLSFVQEFMNYGSPLNQVFVMDAIGKLAEAVIQQQDKLRDQMAGGFVHPEAWIKCAKDWKAAYDKAYKL